MFLERGADQAGDRDNAEQTARGSGFNGAVDVVPVNLSLAELIAPYQQLARRHQVEFGDGVLTIEMRVTHNQVVLVKPVGVEMSPAEAQFAARPARPREPTSVKTWFTRRALASSAT